MSEINYSTHKETREIVSEDKIAKLEKQGWSRWTKGNFDRLYFNAQKADVLGLEYRTTGTISDATWNGKGISNGEARRILSMKAYVDIASGKLSVRYYRNGDSDEAEMLRKVAQDSLDSIA